MINVKPWFRRTVLILGSAIPVSFAIGFLGHGEFPVTHVAVQALVVGGFVFLVVGGVLPATLARGKSSVLRSGLVCLVAALLVFPAARLAWRIDLFRFDRYVRRELTTKLESTRAARGEYPESLSALGLPSAASPWLLKRSGFVPKGGGFTISVMDPGVCGHLLTYDSVSTRWAESWESCWF
ncbi:MAG: hypothetical protein ABJC13_14520 [Acidobacteriota bacterium]